MQTAMTTPITARRLLCGVIVCLLGVTVLSAQEINGRWASTGKLLENGEAQLRILVLKQDGEKLSGSIETLSDTHNVTGSVHGDHFELWGVGWSDVKPFITGELTNNELHGTVWGEPMVARRATAKDVISHQAYIPPPALHKVAYNGLAKTPPMGWNSWNLFAEKVDDQTVRTMADAMVTSGMRDAGYIYINIDDTWEGVRDAKGNLQTNHKFPDMKALADYVHSKGLKIGIYSSPGPRTCAGYPASYGHEEQDANTFAAWGIDYLKYDWCSAGSIYREADLQPIYQKMGDALQATGRPIVYSLCEYGFGSVEKWAPEVSGNLWRTTGDISDKWESMIENIEKQAHTAPYAGPGHWNDPDMLEIGNGHMSGDEYRTHMSLWALTAAPLLAGNDVRTMSDETKSILMNREVIAIDQDALGKQASPTKNGNLETWMKPLADGGVAVGVVNLGSAPATTKVTLKELGLSKQVKSVRDVWAHKEVSFTKGVYTVQIPAHATLMLRVSVD